MKKRIGGKMIIAFILTIVLTFFAACSSGLKYNKEYKEYYYSMQTQAFYKSGKSILFRKQNSFSVYANEKEISYGSFERFKTEKFLKLEYNKIYLQEDLNELKNFLENMDQAYFESVDIEDIINSLKYYESYHYYKDYMFSNSSIEAYREIIVEEGVNHNTTGVEGIYIVNGLNEKMKLQSGIIYMQTNIYDNEFSKEAGTYSVEKDFVTMNIYETSTATGNVNVNVVKYLLASFALPPDITIEIGDDTNMEEKTEEWITSVYDAVATQKGKAIGCLTKSFYSTKKI